MNDIDRHESYKQHRLRIQNASSLVNSQAPKPRPKIDDYRNFTFLEMMQALIRRDNQKPNLKTTFEMGELKKHFHLDVEKTTNNSCQKFSIPFHIRQRYGHLEFTQDWSLMQKLLRPTIFLDLENNKKQSIGRLVIQLFTEACPEVVLQFVRTCLAKQHDSFHITRLLFPLWVEAELVFDDKNALTASNIEHDLMAINHGSSSGILSFLSRYLRGSKLRFITFTMSFKPIDVLNGKRIAFGIIKSGQKVLERLQCLEVMRGGKPCQSVYVAACGVCD